MADSRRRPPAIFPQFERAIQLMARSVKSRQSRRRTAPDVARDTLLRVIGGRFRGRTLAYSGDPRTRPMKDRTREAVINLLGPAVKGKHAIDLFAGTGAIGLEAISRGAARATLIERHVPSVRLIRKNTQALGIADLVEIAASDTFFWARGFAGEDDIPWIVFSCPPYDLYVDQAEQMDWLIGHFAQGAPAGSLIVVEADRRFDLQRLDRSERWDVRHYPPAVIAILEV